MLSITVAPGEHALAKALASLPDNGEEAVVHLAPGVYREKLTISRPHTTLQGENAADTAIQWDDGAYIILEDGMKRGTFRTATLMVDACHVTLRNLSIINAAAPREQVGQAVALYADGDYFVCEGCILKSCQDTLFTAPLPPKEVEKNGFIGPKQFAPRTPQRHVYRRCRIQGDIDFIFGGAAAWFEDCDIVAIDGRADRSTPCEGFATAASTPEGQTYGYVFSHCRFLGEGVEDGTLYLGRPWREFAQTVLLHCYVGPHICPEGWHDWNKPAFHQHGFYAEHGSYGPGAAGERAPYLRRLTEEEAAAYTLENLMNSL